MTRLTLTFALGLFAVSQSLADDADSAAQFVLKRNDVVAFVGGTNLVRAQRAGYLEAALTAHYAEAKPRFRDLAWEGDTVYKQSTVRERWRKGAFGGWPEQLERVGATAIIAQFGQSEALDRSSDVEQFIHAYEKLLEQFEKKTTRIIVLSPTPFERVDPPLPDLSLQNTHLRRFTDAIRLLARRRGHTFVDLLGIGQGGTDALTDNGLHLNTAGHRAVAVRVAQRLSISFRHDPVLRLAVVEKHRLWYDYWRPANWKCLYGDDGERIFGKAAGDSVAFREEWKRFPKLIENAEARIGELTVRDRVETELASFEVAPGLEINLFASEADGVVNPIAMRWDPRGRLWVACTLVYPQIEPGATPDDRVLILEDTDGDGRADRSIVFASGLNIPTGIELGEGGLYVGQGTELIHLRDLDGDDRADERRVVLSGFGNGDSHQTINSFAWSPGGELYFCQGDGIESRVETPHGVSSLFQAGVWRLRPRRLQLDGFLDDFMGPGNPWGVAFDDWGQTFIADGAGGISFLGPAQLRATHRLSLPRIGKPGGLLRHRDHQRAHFPDDYQGNFLLGDYHRNAVSRFATRPAGAGFAVDWKDPLVRSTHKSFRPVDIRTGPDGAVYHRRLVQPGDLPSGRLVPSPGERPHARPHLARACKRARTRKSAAAHRPAAVDSFRRIAIARALGSLSDKACFDISITGGDRPCSRRVGGVSRYESAGLRERHLYEAIGAYETGEIARPRLLMRLLDAADPLARAYATRVVDRWWTSFAAPLQLLARSAEDEHPLVRLEAVVAAAQVPLPSSIEVAASVVDRPTDRFIDYALTQAVHTLRPYWLPAFRTGHLTFDGDTARMAAVLRHVRSDDLRDTLIGLATSADILREHRVTILHTLVELADDDAQRFLLSPEAYEVAPGYDFDAHRGVLAALTRHSRHDDLDATEVARQMQVTLARPKLRAAVLELAAAWSIDDLREDARRIAFDENAGVDDRRAAMVTVARLDDGDTAELAKAMADGQSAALREASLIALASIDADNAARHAPEVLTLPGVDVDAVLTAFARRRSGEESLARALQKSSIDLATAERCLDALTARGHARESLLTTLRTAYESSRGLPTIVWQPSSDSHVTLPLPAIRTWRTRLPFQTRRMSLLPYDRRRRRLDGT